MKNRSQRLFAIQEIIRNSLISTQEEILLELVHKGIQCTQATLSRDLKVLKVSRVVDESGKLIYSVPGDENSKKPDDSDIHLLTGNINSLDFSNALALIKTLPGYANSVAIRIDKVNALEILGTIAGDDTILIVPREGFSRTQVRDRLFRIFPGLKSRIR